MPLMYFCFYRFVIALLSLPSFFFLMISLSEGGRSIDGDSARVDCFIEKMIVQPY